jgi:hypothetical protein
MRVICQWVCQKMLLAILWSAGHRMSDRSFQQPVIYFAQSRFGDTVRFLLSGTALSCISCRIIIAYSGRKTLTLQGIYKACLNEIV